MAVRDAGDFGFGMEFADAVRKGRAERWSDRDLAALLHCTEEEVRAVPLEKTALNLEDLKFRDDAREGGKVIEYQVDGRAKTQTVPLMVGQVLESVVREHLVLRSLVHELIGREKDERLSVTGGRSGSRGNGAGPAGRRPAGKEKGSPPKAGKGHR